MVKRKIGRPMKGPIPARDCVQLSIRLLPDLAKKWQQYQRRHPHLTQAELFAALLMR